jgi:regulator of cell morphogenesis and NO signaling
MATDKNCTIYDHSAHPTELAYALERVKQEHIALREQVDELETCLNNVSRTYDLELAKKIVSLAKVFSQACDEHASWEEKELLPYVEDYYRMNGGPEIATSAWMMEKDHELASEFLRLFMDKADRLPQDFDMEEWKKISAHLLQACYIYKDHFELEEQVLFSSAFLLLDEIDYMFS